MCLRIGLEPWTETEDVMVMGNVENPDTAKYIIIYNH